MPQHVQVRVFELHAFNCNCVEQFSVALRLARHVNSSGCCDLACHTKCHLTSFLVVVY